jgi:hypothetical protein
MSVTISVEVNNTIIYANFLASNTQRILNNIGVEVSSDFTGRVPFKELLPCINKLLSIIKQYEADLNLDQPSNDSDAWLSRYYEVLTVFTTAYTFGKDVNYA